MQCNNYILFYIIKEIHKLIINFFMMNEGITIDYIRFILNNFLGQIVINIL